MPLGSLPGVSSSCTYFIISSTDDHAALAGGVRHRLIVYRHACDVYAPIYVVAMRFCDYSVHCQEGAGPCRSVLPLAVPERREKKRSSALLAS